MSGPRTAAAVPAAAALPVSATAGVSDRAAGPETAVATLAEELAALEDRFGLDVDATLTRAVEIGRAAEEIGDGPLQLRARLLEANMRRRGGDIAAAVRVCWEVNAWATEQGHGPLLTRSHLQLSAIYHNLGDAAAGLDHAVSAVGFLDDDSPPRTRAVCLMKLGDDLAMGGSFQAARERYRQAEDVAVASEDVETRIVVLNNQAYADYLAGEPELSWATIEHLQSVAADAGQRLKPDALDTMARIQIARGRFAEAERIALDTLDEYASSGLDDVDSIAEFLLTLAVAQRHLGAIEAARASMERCAVLCAERDLAGVGVRALQERAELCAASGDPRQAFELHKEFHAADQRLVSKQREAQARTRQAMLETTEARRDAERFREQARRDPLTGLRNRRYVDEQLPSVIDGSIRTGSPVTVAILDLDHFKRVNDTCSHDVGDQVLTAFAGVLSAAVPGSGGVGAGFAARLGGEEFLLVLAEMTPAEAVGRIEDLRRAVAEHEWQPITGELSVTVSVGVTTVQPDSTQPALLARADESLYVAKRTGRNRVSVDPGVTLADRRHFRDNRPGTD